MYDVYPVDWFELLTKKDIRGTSVLFDQITSFYCPKTTILQLTFFLLCGFRTSVRSIHLSIERFDLNDRLCNQLLETTRLYMFHWTKSNTASQLKPRWNKKVLSLDKLWSIAYEYPHDSRSNPRLKGLKTLKLKYPRVSNTYPKVIKLHPVGLLDDAIIALIPLNRWGL